MMARLVDLTVTFVTSKGDRPDHLRRCAQQAPTCERLSWEMLEFASVHTINWGLQPVTCLTVLWCAWLGRNWLYCSFGRGFPASPVTGPAFTFDNTYHLIDRYGCVPTHRCRYVTPRPARSNGSFESIDSARWDGVPLGWRADLGTVLSCYGWYDFMLFSDVSLSDLMLFP